MGNSLRLYHTSMEFLFNSAVQRHDIRVFSTLAWAIVGLLLSHHVSPNRWCQHRPGAAQAESRVRQLARWLHNPKIEAVQIYRPLTPHALLSYAVLVRETQLVEVTRLVTEIVEIPVTVTFTPTPANSPTPTDSPTITPTLAASQVPETDRFSRIPDPSLVMGFWIV